jgi:hypothetical protein
VNEVPSSVDASKMSCSASPDPPFPLGGNDSVQTYATAKLFTPLGRLMVTVPDVSAAAVNGPEPTLAATAVGVPPVMVNVTTAGEPSEPSPLLLKEPPQPTTSTSARTPQRAEKRRTGKYMKVPDLAETTWKSPTSKRRWQSAFNEFGLNRQSSASVHAKPRSCESL